MHVLWLFFTWPAGAVWGNVFAMPLCGVVAAFAAFLGRDRLGRALRSWWRKHFGHGDELNDIKARLDGHADLLNPDTPGGLAAVMAELRDTKMAAESALAGVEALAKLTAKPAARRGSTELRRTGSGKADDAR